MKVLATLARYVRRRLYIEVTSAATWQYIATLCHMSVANARSLSNLNMDYVVISWGILGSNNSDVLFATKCSIWKQKFGNMSDVTRNCQTAVMSTLYYVLDGRNGRHCRKRNWQLSACLGRLKVHVLSVTMLIVLKWCWSKGLLLLGIQWTLWIHLLWLTVTVWSYLRKTSTKFWHSPHFMSTFAPPDVALQYSVAVIRLSHL